VVNNLLADMTKELDPQGAAKAAAGPAKPAKP